MKALDILVSARARLAANRHNWTVNTLAAKSRLADDGKCFCSLGGVLHAGGGFTDDLDFVINKMESDLTQQGIVDGKPYYLHDDYTNVGALNEYMFANKASYVPKAYDLINKIKERLSKYGFEAKPTITALNYLQAASTQVMGRTDGYRSVVAVNDADSSGENYARVLQMFDIAIKNAKRRHVNGGRVAKKVAQ